MATRGEAVLVVAAAAVVLSGNPGVVFVCLALYYIYIALFGFLLLFTRGNAPF